MSFLICAPVIYKSRINFKWRPLLCDFPFYNAKGLVNNRNGPKEKIFLEEEMMAEEIETMQRVLFSGLNGLKQSQTQP